MAAPFSVFNPSSGTPRRCLPWDRTLLHVPRQGKGPHAAPSTGLTCDVCAHGLIHHSGPAQGTIPLPVPLELVHDTLPYGKTPKTNVFQSRAKGSLDVVPASPETEESESQQPPRTPAQGDTDSQTPEAAPPLRKRRLGALALLTFDP